jgi:hypothetical protein
MLMDELGTIDAPVSDMSAGIATGLGFGLAIIGIALGVAALTGC